MLQSLPMRDVEIATEWRSTVSKVMQLFREGRILRAGLGFVLALNACSLLAQETTSQTSDSAQQSRDEQIQNLQRKLDEIQQQIIQLQQRVTQRVHPRACRCPKWRQARKLRHQRTPAMKLRRQ